MGFSAIAVTTVSVFMMVAELRWSSQALICSSIVLGLALKHFDFHRARHLTFLLRSTNSSSGHMRSVTFAAMAGVTGKVLCSRTRFVDPVGRFPSQILGWRCCTKKKCIKAARTYIPLVRRARCRLSVKTLGVLRTSKTIDTYRTQDQSYSSIGLYTYRRRLSCNLSLVVVSFQNTNYKDRHLYSNVFAASKGRTTWQRAS